MGTVTVGRSAGPSVHVAVGSGCRLLVVADAQIRRDVASRRRFARREDADACAGDDVQRDLFAPDRAEQVAGGTGSTNQVRRAPGELLDRVQAPPRDVDADDTRPVEIGVVGDAHVRVTRELRVLEHQPPPRRVGQRKLGRARVAVAARIVQHRRGDGNTPREPDDREPGDDCRRGTEQRESHAASTASGPSAR